MNSIEKWITDNRIKRPKDFAEKFREIGFKVNNVLPPVFESYAIIFHPYKIPKGQLITEREKIKQYEKKFIENVNNLIAKEIGISSKELPTQRYDFEEVIRDTLNSRSVEKSKIEETVKKLELEALKLAVEPAQYFFNCIKEGVMPDEPTYDLKEVTWNELYQLYGLEFNYKAMWATLGKKIKSEDIFEGQESPEMDNMPKSIIKKIKVLLKKQNIKNVVVNTQEELDSEDLNINLIDNLDWVNLIASINKEWIFITPHDFCRTIVAGNNDFVQQIIESKTFEISNNLTENQRLDIYA